MDKIIKKGHIAIISILIAMLFLISYLYYYKTDYGTIEAISSHASGDLVTFNYESGMYDSSLGVILSKDKEVPAFAKIYYTLNGDNPTIEKGELYKSPIQLSKSESFTVYPIKAVIYYNGEYSDIYENDFILCDDVSNEYNVYIVSVTSDSENLYNYDTGILVRGKIFEEYVSRGVPIENIWQGNSSERGEEWIKPAHLILIDRNGNLLINQSIRLRVSGSTSSGLDVKSLKVYANTVTDENNKFYLNIENEDTMYMPYSFVNKYKSLRFRSGSQDMYYGKLNIRSSIVSRLAQSSNFDGISSSNRCILFLNGDFYGIFDIQQNYSNSYIADRFGLDNSENIEKIKGTINTFWETTSLHNLFDLDLNIKYNQYLLESKIDMDNYLLYYAINILCNNIDWPQNNYEAWRYTGPYDGNNPYTDGRFRFLLYDVDYIYPTYLARYVEESDGDIFIYLMEELFEAYNTSFPNVMNSEFYRNKFVTMVLDLLNTTFSTDNILKITDEEDKKINALKNKYYSEDYIEDSKEALQLFKQDIIKRPSEISDDLEKYFGLKDKYKFALETSDGVLVSWNNMYIYRNDSYTCNYYKNVANTITAEPYPGYEFLYWEINGEKIYDPVIEISGEMAEDGLLSIKAVASLKDTEDLIINEISAEGYSDWIRIYNAGNLPAWLAEYYISDNELDIQKYRLPEVILQPHEDIIIYGSKNHNAVGDYICNFSLKKGEFLTLSNSNQIMDKIMIPQMSDCETYKRYDNSNRWMFYKGE